MENCLELAIRTEGAVGSVAPTIEQGIVLAIYLPNARAKEKKGAKEPQGAPYRETKKTPHSVRSRALSD